MNWKTLLSAICCTAAAYTAQAQSFGDEPPWSDEEQAMFEAQAEAGRAYALRLADALAADGGARDLALAAILRDVANFREGATPSSDDGQPSQRVAPDAQADAWRRAAARSARDDVMANQLLMAGNAADGAALRQQAVTRWATAEPGNLAPLLQQRLPVDELLARARGTSHSDHHMYDNVRWIMSAYLRHPPTQAEALSLSAGEPFHAEEIAAVSAMGIWVAVATPALASLGEACRGPALRATPDRLSGCSNIATLLAERSDSSIERRVGLGILRETATDTYARRDIDARQRRMDWQMQRWGEVAARQERDGAAQFVRLLRDTSIRSEQQLMERVLQEAGVPLEPPVEWQSPWRGR